MPLKSFIVLLLAIISLHANPPGDSLFSQFQDPPESARPRTWWHWTGGNVTLEGISRDLAWMKRAGIAGFQLADVRFGGGQSVAEKKLFGSPDWLAAVDHAAREAQRLDLEMAVFSSAGWSLTGGPWVTPEQAMKKLVWSDTLVQGGHRLSAILPHPPVNTGPIGNFEPGRRPDQEPEPTFYGDVAVLAYQTTETRNPAFSPNVSSHAGELDGSALFDDDLNTSLSIPAPENGDPAWIQYRFEKPFTARALTLAAARGIPLGRLSASENGVDFQPLVELPGAQLYRQGWVRTFALPETRVRYFRLEMTAAPLNPAETMLQEKPQSPTEYTLAEFILHGEARIHRWEEKAGFRHLFEYESVPTPETDQAIPTDGVINLTGQMDESGRLDWRVPAGSWRILRLGYSLTGAKTRPAMPTGHGLEVDKLSPRHTAAYIRDYMKPYAETLGPLYGKTLRYVLMDSWEAGTQNWTDSMLVEFRRRRGYDARPYLPALAGRVVGSAEISDRFLWDFRRTLADMFAENHYGVIAAYLREAGLGTYAEASGVSLEIPEDALMSKKFVDIPMGEFWVRALHPELMYYQDVRGAASATHLYGKKIVAAEAFTGGGYEAPFTLKKTADYWFCQGVNRLVFHTTAHQPHDSLPGNTMVGTHLHRNITWAEQARPFIDYLSRTSLMLQQGQFAADLLYLLNEGAPSTMPIWGAGLQPEPPAGYDFDYINADGLLHRLSVNANGELQLPDGMTYRVLVLPPVDRMTLPVLRHIKMLAEAGATVVGPRPVASPGLNGYPAADREIRTLAAALWGDLDGISRFRRQVGKGQVVWGLPLARVLSDLNLPPDVEFEGALDAKVHWIHRRTAEGDLYFVVNDADRPREFEVRFRVSGKEPELWFPDSGERQSVPYRIADSLTTVSLSLPSHGSVFVVFDKVARKKAGGAPQQKEIARMAVKGPWQVAFPPNFGAPPAVQFDSLISWTAHPEPGIKFFSGTATYRKTVKIPGEWFKQNARILLDLGAVGDIAGVSINGREAGLLWKPPYRIDVSELVKAGENRIEISVTNQWSNRLLGDRSPEGGDPVLPPGSKNIRFFFNTPPLLDSGLMGPVFVVRLLDETRP